MSLPHLQKKKKAFRGCHIRCSTGARGISSGDTPGKRREKRCRRSSGDNQARARVVDVGNALVDKHGISGEDGCVKCSEEPGYHNAQLPRLLARNAVCKTRAWVSWKEKGCVYDI
jgi:hypothetical protein